MESHCQPIQLLTTDLRHEIGPKGSQEEKLAVVERQIHSKDAGAGGGAYGIHIPYYLLLVP